MFTTKAWPRDETPRVEHFRVETAASVIPGWQDAAAVQRSLMPPPSYTGTFVRAAAANRQCRSIGGDFYDYLDTGCEFRVVLGDVCGKGTPAALQAAWVQGTLSAAIERQATPADAMAYLNRALCGRTTSNRFVTLFYGVLTASNRLTYCNAGQCRPMLVNHHSLRRLSVGGIPPGMFGDTVYKEESVAIETGDTLIVFSDGVSEASRQSREFGDARIGEIATAYCNVSASAIVEEIVRAVRAFTGGGRQRDDMSVLAVRYTA